MATTDTDTTTLRTNRWRNTGLWAGPLLALLVYGLLPHQYRDSAGEVLIFSSAGRATVAMMVWMAVWWLSETVAVAVTALLPVAVFPLLGIATIKTATAPYASDLIFLFLGGFAIALAMQRWRLDQRIALLALRLTGSEPHGMVAGVMIATALLSAFVSNTATAAMMLPVGLSVINLVMTENSSHTPATSGYLPEDAGRNFALCLLLGIAYAASIGGIATIIGSPPNLFVVGFIKETIAEPYRQEVSFLRWLSIGGPLALVLLPMTWLLLTRVLYPIKIRQIPGGSDLIAERYRELGPLSRGEGITLAVFFLTALAWISRPYLPIEGLSDSGIAIISALALFVIPAGKNQPVLDWETARELPWGILILFGGGLSLAAAVNTHGVAEFIGSQTTEIGGWPVLVVILIVVAAVIFLTELTSNTATTATLVPVLAALAPGLDLHPYQLIIPAAISASCAFMMPVATPPNAIVFGSGCITIGEMCKAGWWLNLVAIAIITALAGLIIPLALNFG